MEQVKPNDGGKNIKRFSVLINISKWMIPFLIGTFLGSGAIWQWKQLRIEEIKQSIELRDKIEDKLLKAIKLFNEYSDIIKSDVVKRSQFEAQFNLLKDDLVVLENKLAHIEHRKPRDIFAPLVPKSPAGIRLED